jgi:methionyl-tRNA formyltransferase
MSSSWRIVLFTDFPAVATWYPEFFASHGHQVVALVTSPRRDFGYREVMLSTDHDIDVIRSNHPSRWYGMLRDLQPDLIVSTVFPWRIPENVLRMAPLGAVNAHPTLLPRYRGTGPLKWMLWNDERFGGWTLHRMVSDFDAGPILAQTRFPIDDDDDIPTLHLRINENFGELWELGLPAVARNDPGTPQDESQALVVGRMPASMQIVDWSRNARDIHNQIRAMSGGIPPHGAIADVDGVRLMLRRSKLVDDAASGGRSPGDVIARDGDSFTIQCGDMPLRIVVWEPMNAQSPAAVG